MKFGRYVTQNKLGNGSMGVVYQAYDPQIERTIALKLLRPDRLKSRTYVGRFLKEAKAIGRLSHPNIVMVYDIGKQDDNIYIAMELLEGKPLNHYASEKKLTCQDIIGIGCQLAEALDYASKQGVIHRDIKPKNIIINADSRLKITDFGVAHLDNTEAILQTQAGQILGTPVYMSPEQIHGQEVDGRSDLFSLGVILYELSTGKRPFGGKTIWDISKAISEVVPPEPCQVNPTIPFPLSKVIMKSLEKKPEKRFQNGKDMAEALHDCLRTVETEKTVKVILNKNSNRFRIFVIVFLLTLVGAFAGGAYYYNQHQNEKEKTLPVISIQPKTEKRTQVQMSILTIDSTPVGARVYINGDLKGTTPVSLKLAYGKYETELSLTGYHDKDFQLTLKKPEQEVKIPLQLIE